LLIEIQEPYTSKPEKMEDVVVLLLLVGLVVMSEGQIEKSVIDFSKAIPDPQTGQLCVMQEVCIADIEALSRLLPSEPCLSEGCTCTSDADCVGSGTGRCVACNCMECPVSVGKDIVNPPLTFLIDTTRSVKPDKDSIFNLTQRVVNKIETGNVNIPNYLLVTFNDYGPDINQNVVTYPATRDVEEFKSESISFPTLLQIQIATLN
jgi:hypothetical protein